MRRLIIAALLAAGPAMADMVASNGAGDELRLFDRPCTIAAILAGIKPEFHSKFQAGQALIGGKVIRLCYIDTQEGSYFVVPEGSEGGGGIVYSVTMFTSSPGV